MTPLAADIKDYRTSPVSVSMFSKAFPGFRFYSYFVWLVLKAGIRAKHGNYDNESWRQNSLALLRALEKVGMCFEITGFWIFSLWH